MRKLGGCMKKKLLSFILAICLIIPCAFMMAACDNGDKPVDLSGARVAVKQIGEIDWDGGCFSMHYEDPNNNYKHYSISLSYEQFVEMFWQTDAYKSLVHNDSINSMQEAKDALEYEIQLRICSKNPTLKFSQDGMSFTTYDYTDKNYQNPLETYSVVKQTGSDFGYEINKNSNMMGYIFTHENTNIECQGSIGGPFIHNWRVENLSGFSGIEITLKASDDPSDVMTKPIIECEGSLEFFVEKIIYEIK